ncbi:MAG: T9SS type A sorting domain-containing protein [Bacteroidota bacterium]|jgi:hypothetical protein
MKKLFILLTLLTSVTHGFSQNVNHQFSISFSSSGDDRGRALAIDDFGNSFVTGSFSNQISVGGSALNSNGGTDIYVTKFDVFGNVSWTKQIGGSGNDAGRDITLDNAGNVILVGYFNGSVDFNPGIGAFQLNSYGMGDGFLLKLDSTGDFVYAGNIGGSDEDRVETVSYDPLYDDIAIGGWFQGVADISPNPETDLNFGSSLVYSHGATDFFVSMLDNEYPNSSFYYGWARGGIADDYLQEISFDNDGNLVLLGDFSENVNFAPLGVTLYGGGISGFLGKFDWDGDPYWVKNVILGGTTYGLCVRPDNSIACSGVYYYTGNFEYSNLDQFGNDLGGQNISLESTSIDGFVATFNSAGIFLNLKNFVCDGYDGIYSLTSDESGNVYMAGDFENIMNVGGINLSSSGSSDIYIAKLNYSLDALWAKSTGGAGIEYPWDIKLYPNEDIGFVSNFQGSNVDFDPNSSTNLISSAGGYDGAYSKWCNIGTPIITPNGPTTFCQNQQVTLSTTGFTSYLWSNSQAASSITVGQTGNYSLIATNSTGCSQSSAPTSVIVNPLPNVTTNVNPSNTVCEGSTITLTGAGALTYTWNNGIINNTPFVITSSGGYSVIGTDANGCQNSASINMNVNMNPVIFTNLTGDTLTVSAAGNYNYQWYNCATGLLPGETLDTLFGEFNQEYYVQATSQQGCTTNSDCILITKIDDQEIIAFSVYPNPANDRIFVNGRNNSSTQVSIFDIYGKLVLNQMLIGRELDIAELSAGSYILTIPEYGYKKSIIKL